MPPFITVVKGFEGYTPYSRKLKNMFNKSEIFVVLIVLALFAVPAMATGQYYESKYKEIDIVKELQEKPESLSCDLYGNVKAGKSLTTEIRMYRANDNSGKFEIIPVEDDGTYKYLGLAPGKFYLHPYPFGNGMQDENVTVTCRAGSGVVRPEQEILGCAVSVPKTGYITVEPSVTVTPTPTQTPSNCHYHEGYWKRVCVGHHCFNIWVPEYWHCDWHCNNHNN